MRLDEYIRAKRTVLDLIKEIEKEIAFDRAEMALKLTWELSQGLRELYALQEMMKREEVWR